MSINASHRRKPSTDPVHVCWSQHISDKCSNGIYIAEELLWADLTRYSISQFWPFDKLKELHATWKNTNWQDASDEAYSACTALIANSNHICTESDALVHIYVDNRKLIYSTAKELFWCCKSRSWVSRLRNHSKNVLDVKQQPWIFANLDQRLQKAKNSVHIRSWPYRPFQMLSVWKNRRMTLLWAQYVTRSSIGWYFLIVYFEEVFIFQRLSTHMLATYRQYSDHCWEPMNRCSWRIDSLLLWGGPYRVVGPVTLLDRLKNSMKAKQDMWRLWYKMEDYSGSSAMPSHQILAICLAFRMISAPYSPTDG